MTAGQALNLGKKLSDFEVTQNYFQTHKHILKTILYTTLTEVIQHF